MDTTLERELARYDGVIFFESAAVGGLSIEGGNPARLESIGKAAELDAELRAVWSQHPNFRLVSHQESFLRKITTGFAILEDMVGDLFRVSED